VVSRRELGSQEEFYSIDWKALRRLLGWSQYAAADFLGIARHNVLHWERAGYIPAAAWDRLESFVELAMELRRQAEVSPVQVYPRHDRPRITAKIEIE